MTIIEDKRDRADQFIRPGFFRVRFGKGFPWLPAIIFRPCPIEMPEDGDWVWLDRWPLLQGMRDANALGAFKEACDPYWVWLNGVEITKDECIYWIQVRVHIKLYEPDAPDADPRKKIDLNKAAPIGPKGIE